MIEFIAKDEPSHCNYYIVSVCKISPLAHGDGEFVSVHDEPFVSFHLLSIPANRNWSFSGWFHLVPNKACSQDNFGARSNRISRALEKKLNI